MDKIYSIYDRVAEEFSPPWVSVNDGTAMRQFRQAKQKMVGVGENDLQLMALSNWDPHLGLIAPLAVPAEVSLMDTALNVTDLTDLG